MVKFAFTSDLHVDLNTYPNDLRAWRTGKSQQPIYPWDSIESDTIVLCGDTSNDFVTTCAVIQEAAKYREVIFLDGNHDFYGCRRTGETVGSLAQKFRDFAIGWAGDINYLNVGAFGDESFLIIDDVAFVGTNGWYNWDAVDTMTRQEEFFQWKTQINDSRLINYDPNGMPDKLATRDSNALYEQIQKYQEDPAIRAIVVLTHTIPNKKGMVGGDHPWVPTNGSYFNSFMIKNWFFPGKIKFWGFGHTHEFYDFNEHGIRFLSNPRGYMGEKRSKEWAGFVEVEV